MSEKKEYIERGAALELFWEYSGNWNLINAIPDADVEPVVRGEWKEETFECPRENWDVEYKCSACGRYRYSITNYCPNCGAKMDGEKEGV